MHPIQHFQTITRHRHMVMRHCIKAGIPIQGLLHDLSKYTPTEFIPGALYYQGTRSPNEEERERIGYSSAWLHHKGRNRHHFEYWVDYSMKTRKKEPVRMPVRYVAEMFCDRLAASKIYFAEQYDDSKPMKYFEKGRGRRFMHPTTSRQLERLLRMLEERGEDAVFTYIRRVVKPASIKNGTW